MCVVDPISRLTPLLDRSLTRELLEDLEDAKVSDTTVVRAPRSVEVRLVAILNCFMWWRWCSQLQILFLRFMKIVPSEQEQGFRCVKSINYFCFIVMLFLMLREHVF